MKRSFPMAVAQLGPIHLADSREAVVARLLQLLHESHARGAKFVVFPELALTTFFPRYWMEDQEEIDRFFERSMPNAATQPLFDEARRYGIGFYLGYAELVKEDGRKHRFNTSILSTAPHPNAAQVLSNYLVTVPGQEAIARKAASVLPDITGATTTVDKVRVQDLDVLTPEFVAEYQAEWNSLFK